MFEVEFRTKSVVQKYVCVITRKSGLSLMVLTFCVKYISVLILRLVRDQWDCPRKIEQHTFSDKKRANQEESDSKHYLFRFIPFLFIIFFLFIIPFISEEKFCNERFVKSRRQIGRSPIEISGPRPPEIISNIPVRRHSI